MDKIIEILKEINEEVVKYDGDNLFEAGILDSLKVIDMISELEDQLDIEIDAKYVIEDNFKTKEAIVAMILKIQGQ